MLIDCWREGGGECRNCHSTVDAKTATLTDLKQPEVTFLFFPRTTWMLLFGKPSMLFHSPIKMGQYRLFSFDTILSTTILRHRYDIDTTMLTPKACTLTSLWRGNLNIHHPVTVTSATEGCYWYPHGTDTGDVYSSVLLLATVSSRRYIKLKCVWLVVLKSGNSYKALSPLLLDIACSLGFGTW